MGFIYDAHSLINEFAGCCPTTSTGMVSRKSHYRTTIDGHRGDCRWFDPGTHGSLTDWKGCGHGGGCAYGEQTEICRNGKITQRKIAFIYIEEVGWVVGGSSIEAQYVDTGGWTNWASFLLDTVGVVLVQLDMNP